MVDVIFSKIKNYIIGILGGLSGLLFLLLKIRGKQLKTAKTQVKKAEFEGKLQDVADSAEKQVNEKIAEIKVKSKNYNDMVGEWNEEQM